MLRAGALPVGSDDPGKAHRRTDRHGGWQDHRHRQDRRRSRRDPRHRGFHHCLDRCPCSGCAVIYSEHGEFEAVHYQNSNPAAVIVDTQIIAEAPVRFLVAGMGCALATWLEAKSCSRTQSPNECGGLSTLTGLSLARLCSDTLLQYGVAAKLAEELHLVTRSLEHMLKRTPR